MSESILAILKHEHQEIKELIEQIEDGLTSKQISDHLGQLNSLLNAHMQAEEKTIYQRLYRVTPDKAGSEMARDLVSEHNQLREHLEKMITTDAGTTEWKKEFHSFKEHFYQHVLEEESELFDEVREDFSAREIERLTMEYEEDRHHPRS